MAADTSSAPAAPAAPASSNLVSPGVVALCALVATLLATFLYPAAKPAPAAAPSVETTLVANASTMPLQITPRKSEDRGHADHGWLKTFHTFSFAMYQDSEHDAFGCLRVINEDRVAPGTGFGTHPHREFEIFSYVVDGELQHRDSMGNLEILKRGDLQMTSAGTGIRHSEHQHGAAPVHFLQIWAVPHTRGLPPAYYTRHVTDAEKRDKWARVVAPVGADGVKDEREADGPAPVHAALEARAAILSAGAELAHALPASAGPRKAYVHVIQRSGYNPKRATGASIRVAGEGADIVLREGDGAYLVGEPGQALAVQNVGDVEAELIFFDVDI